MLLQRSTGLAAAFSLICVHLPAPATISKAGFVLLQPLSSHRCYIHTKHWSACLQDCFSALPWAIVLPHWCVLYIIFSAVPAKSRIRPNRPFSSPNKRGYKLIARIIALIDKPHFLFQLSFTYTTTAASHYTLIDNFSLPGVSRPDPHLPVGA